MIGTVTRLGALICSNCKQHKKMLALLFIGGKSPLLFHSPVMSKPIQSATEIKFQFGLGTILDDIHDL